MARVTFEGLDELITDMERMGEQAGEVFEEMLDAGALEVVDAWKKSAEKHGHIDTGEMRKNTRHTKIGTKGGSKIAHIYPRGKDKNGVRHASKAFYRHYGTTRKKATYWIDTAEKEAAKTAPGKVFAIWSDYIRRGGK